jgi:hypothetical protein
MTLSEPSLDHLSSQSNIFNMKVALAFLLVAFLTAQVFSFTPEEYETKFEQWVEEKAFP